MQPAIILIDHGHFQYNTVALGLSLWSFHFMTKGSSFINCVWGSFFFCMALNFKQMTLYYAPAVFMYLLGRCFVSRETFLARFSSLALTVIASFGMLWWPFFVYPYVDEASGTNFTSTESALHVLRRLFPFQRGLFEGKVSNLWCVLSIKPVNIRTRIPEQYQPVLALVLTLLFILPLSVKLLRTGAEFLTFDTTKIEGKRKAWEQENHHLKILLLGSTTSGLSFFLASFQVHEKSILMALSTISLLFIDNPSFVAWFSVIASWTLWPLLTVDKLMLAYFTSNTIFMTFLWLFSVLNATTKPELKGFFQLLTYKLIFPLSMLSMIGLHTTELIVQPPEHLPDLFPVLWSILGCGLFCWSWICCSFTLLASSNCKNTISSDIKVS